MASDYVRNRLITRLHEVGYTDLVLAHTRVLQYPGPDNLRPSDLAAQAGMSKQAVNYLLGQLVDRGYLVRDGDSNDRRLRRVRLTERGWAAQQDMRGIIAEIELDWQQQLGEEDFRHLRDTLHRLRMINYPTGYASDPGGAPPNRRGSNKDPVVEFGGTRGDSNP